MNGEHGSRSSFLDQFIFLLGAGRNRCRSRSVESATPQSGPEFGAFFPAKPSSGLLGPRLTVISQADGSDSIENCGIPCSFPAGSLVERESPVLMRVSQWIFFLRENFPW